MTTPEEAAARITETRALLERLGFDATRSNERSALTLLALLSLPPTSPWSAATGDKTHRTKDIIAWIAATYGRTYAVNTREDFRKETLRQFVAEGLVLHNPDDPGRPTNSPLNCYQIAPEALAILQQADEPSFTEQVEAYLVIRPGLKVRYARARDMARIPVTLPDGEHLDLSPGGQNLLIKQMIEEFCPRFTPGGQVLYIGDTARGDAVFDREALAALGVELDEHGKFPDLIIYMPDRNWIILMEAADSHGPVDTQRHADLEELFSDCTAGRVYVTCFATRLEWRAKAADIAWETECWCADSPDHMIHFNGERFLGPYK